MGRMDFCVRRACGLLSVGVLTRKSPTPQHSVQSPQAPWGGLVGSQSSCFPPDPGLGWLSKQWSYPKMKASKPTLTHMESERVCWDTNTAKPAIVLSS